MMMDYTCITYTELIFLILLHHLVSNIFHTEIVYEQGLEISHCRDPIESQVSLRKIKRSQIRIR